MTNMASHKVASHSGASLSLAMAILYSFCMITMHILIVLSTMAIETLLVVESFLAVESVMAIELLIAIESYMAIDSVMAIRLFMAIESSSTATPGLLVAGQAFLQQYHFTLDSSLGGDIKELTGDRR